MSKKGIIFKLSASYFQEQNRVSEKVDQTIIDITYIMIFNENINNNLWLKIILAMIYVKNIRPTSLLKNKNLYKVNFNKTPELSHL